MNYQTESNRGLYGQLLAECARGGGPPSRGLSFVSKRLRGSLHWYLQLTVGSAKTQHYLGPDTPELRQRIEHEKALWARAAPQRKSRERLVAMLLAGDAATVGASEARLFELLERTGVFLIGGTVVGSHAFAIYANMLGVHWQRASVRTQDLDLAVRSHLSIAVGNESVDLRTSLLESDMGFFEIPALNRKHPSTRYSIRGRELTVDLLTPMAGRASSKPVEIPSLGAAAEPVRFLEYLLDATETAVIVARAGVLVNVPTPARYALHKVVTAKRRTAAMQTKGLKDIEQAAQLIEVLLADRRGDLLLALDAARAMPPKFLQQLRSGLESLPDPVRCEILDLLDD